MLKKMTGIPTTPISEDPSIIINTDDYHGPNTREEISRYIPDHPETKEEKIYREKMEAIEEILPQVKNEMIGIVTSNQANIPNHTDIILKLRDLNFNNVNYDSLDSGAIAAVINDKLIQFDLGKFEEGVVNVAEIQSIIWHEMSHYSGLDEIAYNLNQLSPESFEKGYQNFIQKYNLNRDQQNKLYKGLNAKEIYSRIVAVRAWMRMSYFPLDKTGVISLKNASKNYGDTALKLQIKDIMLFYEGQEDELVKLIKNLI